MNVRSGERLFSALNVLFLYCRFVLDLYVIFYYDVLVCVFVFFSVCIERLLCAFDHEDDMFVVVYSEIKSKQ